MGFKRKDVAEQYLRKFPHTPTLTLAKLAFRENKAIWSTLESCRSAIRGIRGAMGKNSKSRTIKELVRPKGLPADPFGPIPQPLQHFNQWEAVRFDAPGKWLVLPDVHIPYHDAAALACAIRTGDAEGCTNVLLNGDFADCHEVSFWEKDPRKRDFAREIEMVKQTLQLIRNVFPKGLLVYKIGNHEERYERYMRIKCPEFLGVPEFEFASIFGLREVSATLVSEKRPIRLGELNVLHGHEYKFNISNPVNPARGFYLRAKTCVIGSHLHQTSQHSEKNLEGKVISAWSTGCLCDMHPDYSPINNWNHGFAIVDVGEHGAFRVNNYRVIDGEAYR